ncbi:MAG TPA: ABC transporter ATP-binding protein [Gammaproteobacteria bacterium]|nr:ABC transporter ATP-binding protein [Gammaproteobacteria bacterium]
MANIMKALLIKNLKKTYSSGQVALKGINLEVEQGDFFALLGPNGAGKTTIIGIMTSLVNKSAGQVSLFGFDLEKEAVSAKTCIGVVPQEFNFNFFERVIDVIVNQAGYYGIPRRIAYTRAEQYLTQLGLWDKRYVVSRELSGGMKRRLMIARALIHEPKMLILDEPTAGVDIELRRSMWAFLREINAKGTTIILTTHYLEEAESLCRGIAIINKGEIIENTSIKELLSRLNTETIVVDLKRPLAEAPLLLGCETVSKDETTLEITFPKTLNLNDIFITLSKLNIEVLSMRNKANRLEELFIRLVNPV